MLKLTLKYFLVFVGIFLLVAVGVIIFLHKMSKDLPSANEVINYKFDTASEVFDANGKLIHMFAFEHRKLIEISEIPPYFIQMLVAVEDSNFYKHWGLDVKSILRALYANVRSGKRIQGASTITQQLARNMFLSTEKVWSRKLKEALLAMMIERNFTKSEILESYCNKVLFGNGYYGIETASMNYFLKKSSDLTVEEAALLVGLLRGSGLYNPIRNPERAKDRRDFVLKVALDDKIITRKQYNDAVNTELVVNKISITSNRESDYFIEYIRPELERKYGTNQLFTGGLKIYTTIDYDMQIYADSVMNKVLNDFENSRRYRVKYSDIDAKAVNIKTDYVQSGVFAIDPHTGFVKIMIGGRNFQHSKFNRIMQARRQPGSCFKPFLYAAALENGFTTSTVVTDEPIVFYQKGELFWEPKNYTDDFRGPVRIREALQRSINTVAVKVIYDMGPEKVVKLTDRMNFTTKISAFLALSLGSCEVKPFELVTAYSIFPGRGELITPVYISKVTDSRGKILEQATVTKKKVLDPKIAYLMTDMLKTVINAGTGSGARTRGFTMPAGGKTGTTDNYADAWFVGFTKNLVVGTWMGFDNNTTLGRGMTGAVATLPIWTDIMKYYEKKSVADGLNIKEDFSMPQGIVRLPISRRTGLLPADGEETYMESFVEYTQPTIRSDLYFYNYFPGTHFVTEEDHIVDL